MTALEDWSLQCPSHRGRAGQETWWQLGGSVVLTAPRSLAAGDSRMSPLCLLHLPVPPAWVLILTESVLTPKREKMGLFSVGLGEGSQVWVSSWVFVVKVSMGSTIMSLGQMSMVRS